MKTKPSWRVRAVNARTLNATLKTLDWVKPPKWVRLADERTLGLLRQVRRSR